MFVFTWILTFLKRIFTQIARAITLAGYNDKTIYKYFRKRGAQIGEGCVICVRFLGSPYLVSLGNHVWISEDVIFHSHDGGTWVLREKYPTIHVCGHIIVEDNCIIGRAAQLLPNIRIGRNSIVGAGSVVISDVPPNTIVMGVPARPIGSFAKYEERCVPLWKEQLPPGVDTSEKGWRRKRKNHTKIRKHLTNLLMNPEKTKDNIDK
jgi:acetyltransferase-like isoleucine patch superfamily enzyme